MQEECKAPIIMLILRGFSLYNQRKTKIRTGSDTSDGESPKSVRRCEESCGGTSKIRYPRNTRILIIKRSFEMMTSIKVLVYKQTSFISKCSLDAFIKDGLSHIGMCIVW